ncbi:MAG: histidine phosphatase family protein [Bacteroidales bacterium]|jgi:2,3-bisphosphoglycerate-dependent phosphoglycerate mutase|nr:histidine phosphatase family protein [Bacteroidales bacterium]
MDLLVVRHGQSEADILKVIEGRADFGLTELGHKQAEAMAKWVEEHYPINKIYSSPLKRAKQTAEYISKITGIGIYFDDDLMEWQNGLIAGLTLKEADEKYPVPKIKYPHTRVYEQESQIDFRMRAETIMSRIINENNDEEIIVIISHGGMINMLFKSFIESSINSKINISNSDTGIHHWRIKDNKKEIILCNSKEHIKTII